MQIGAVFPHQEIGDDPLVIRDWAQAVEEIGYSHILAYDHVIGAVHADRDPPLWGPYTEQDAFHEPFVLFGYFAACTRHPHSAAAADGAGGEAGGADRHTVW